ncbi:MAG: hypothetical protein WA931_08890, partial [Rhodococcus sp. (in: high G+C Gram-positive bacteria)]
MDSVVTGARRTLIGSILALSLLLLSQGIASAQPETSTDESDGGLFGMCDSLPDAVAGIDLAPGISVGNTCTAATAVADPSGAAGAAVDWAASGAVGEAAEAFLEGFGQAVNLMFTWWLDIPLPDLANPESVGVFHSYFYWITASLVAGSIAVAAVRLAAANASARAERATDTAKILVRTVFATATFAPLLIVTHAGSVKFGKWIVED